MTSTLVELKRNDGSETFTLKANRVQTQVSNGFVTDSVISGTSRKVLGGKLVLELQTYQVDAIIQGMEAADYPNSGSYSDHDYGFKQELERASKEWGFTTADGFDQIVYDGQTIDGVFTSFDFTEDTEQRKRRSYEGTVEWTFLNDFIE